MTEASREDLIEEFLATSGKYPGLAEHLEEQRNAERNPPTSGLRNPTKTRASR